MTKISKAWWFVNLHKIKIIVLTIILYTSLPLLILGVLFLHIFRKGVTIIAKIYDKKVYKLLSPESALLSSFDDLYGIPSNNVVTWFVLSGQVSVEQLRNLIYEKVIIINKQEASGKHLLYSQLQQFPVRFFKFLFWKWDENFSIENHIRIYANKGSVQDDNKIWNESDIQNATANLLRKKWNQSQSLWELLLVPNYYNNNIKSLPTREPKTVMLLRFHESLIGDVSSWFHLVLNNLCDSTNEQELKQIHNTTTTTSINIENTTKNSFGQIYYDKLITLFKLPLHSIKILMDPDYNVEQHCWKVDEKNLMKRDHLKISEKFSVQHVQEIKSIFGVSFSSVVLAATASAIRTTFLSLGHTVPKYVSVEFYPIMEEKCSCDIKDKLCCGYRSPICIKLPVGIASPKERLRSCQESYIKAKKEQVTKLNESLWQIFGLLPFTYFKRIRRNLPWSGTLLLTNFCCTRDPVSILENNIQDVMVASARECGFTMSFVCYDDYIRMSLVIDHKLIPAVYEDVAKDLLKNFYSELVILGIEAIV